MARAYELTGNSTDKTIVDTFFNALWNNHSYATAGYVRVSSSLPEICTRGCQLGFPRLLLASSSCMRVANAIPLGCPLFLPVHTVNWVQRSNSGECWQGPRDLGDFLDSQTEESCTQYNVLKVARRAFITSVDTEKADFYEQAILNGIIGNQNKADPDGATSYIYMQPLGGASVQCSSLSSSRHPLATVGGR
jgi:DUF1680 family protein